MLTHVIPNVVAAYPIQSAFQKLLPVGATGNIRAPFLDVGVLAITKFLFSLGYEWTGIYGIEQFLIIKRDADNIDRLEPFYDLLS